MDINFRRMVIDYEMLREAADLAYQSLLDNAHKNFNEQLDCYLGVNPLENDDIDWLINTYRDKIESIVAVYTSPEAAAESLARGMGLLSNDNEAYFNLSGFRDDEITLRNGYIETPCGDVVEVVFKRKM